MASAQNDEGGVAPVRDGAMGRSALSRPVGDAAIRMPTIRFIPVRSMRKKAASLPSPWIPTNDGRPLLPTSNVGPRWLGLPAAAEWVAGL